jgi:dihydrofolate reductase
MRKIIVQEFITLDGVMQAPGGPDEDTSSGFKYGGWTAPYFHSADEEAGELMGKWLKSTDLLLGRKTFDIFAAYWPTHAEMWPGIMDVTKYCVSATLEKSDWKNSVFLKNVEDIKKIKAEGIFDYAPVRKLIHDFESGRSDSSWQLWNLIVFEAWLARQ